MRATDTETPQKAQDDLREEVGDDLGELLEPYRCGDDEALAAIYQRYKARVERFLSSGFVFNSGSKVCCFRGFESHGDLDDAVAETFKRALGPAAREGYDPAYSFERYLLRIARNWVLQHMRTERRAENRSQSLAHFSSLTPLSGVTPAPLLNPEEEAALTQVRQKLADSLDELEATERQLIDWLLEGRSQRDIARLSGLSRNEVRTLVYGLRRRLRRSMSQRGVSTGEALAWLDARSGLSRSVSWTTEWRPGSMSALGVARSIRSLALPARFGSYLLVEKIGEGGMAEVFRAKKLGLGGFERFVAVKLMRPEVASRPTFVSMFIDEAKIAAQMTHRNIGQILELGRHQGVYFIAMEYIEGLDLGSVWDTMRQLQSVPDLNLACYVAMEVAEALDHAHHGQDASGRPLGIVHRDVSPRNILLSNIGEVKVIDFGLAKAAIQSGSAQGGQRKGTLRYMSPEQLRGDEADGRSDLFSFGAVLYEMITLKRLFRARGDLAAMAAERSMEVLPPSIYNPDIPRPLEDIVLKALAPRPEDRFGSAGQMGESLRALIRARSLHYGSKELARALHRLSS